MALTAVEWNTAAGNDPAKATDQQVLNQFEYTLEETRELVNAANEEDRLEVLDGVCDVKYTLDVLHKMLDHREEYKDVARPDHFSAILEQAYEAHKRGDYNTAAALMVAFEAMFDGITEVLSDSMRIEGAYEEVCANNDLKINMDEQHALATVDYYKQQGVETYMYHTGERDGVDRFCVKRKEDDKIMKFENFPKVELECYL